LQGTVQDTIMKKAEATRLNILQKAFELIYEKGYQTTSIDDILATTKVTKGAFYYHFRNKDQMGLAIIGELLGPSFEANFIRPLKADGDTLTLIYNMMHEILMENEYLRVEYGCPAANFTQEMAPWNADFTFALNQLSASWKDAIVARLERGKASGDVAREVNSEEVAIFMMSGYWGIRNMAKLTNSRSTYLTYLQQLKAYLEGLR